MSDMGKDIKKKEKTITVKGAENESCNDIFIKWEYICIGVIAKPKAIACVPNTSVCSLLGRFQVV